MTNETSESATLTWLPGPGDISHYIVEVNGVELNENVTGLTLDLFNLTAGSLYDVKVFPVKCDRSLNPQNASFYTSKLNTSLIFNSNPINMDFSEVVIYLTVFQPQYLQPWTVYLDEIRFGLVLSLIFYFEKNRKKRWSIN